MRKLKIVAIVFITLTIVSCQKKKQEVAVAEKPIPVSVANVIPANIEVTRVYTGTLEGWKQARIYASIPEAVVALPIKEGSAVKFGQTVIVLNQDGPSSQLRQVKAVFEEAKDNYEKMARLYEQGAIPEQSLNNSKTAFEVAKANYDAVHQQVELTSPIAGILTDLNVNIGQYAPLGAPLATIAQTDKLRLKIYVDDRSVTSLKVGQSAQIAPTAAETNFPVREGTIIEIAQSADPATKLFRVELQIENQAGTLSPGTFARAMVVVQELVNVLTVPREAVFFVEGIPKVYTLADSNRVQERSVEIGESTGESYQVLSGLKEGEKVITLGKSQLENGSLVKIVEEVQSSDIGEISRES